MKAAGYGDPIVMEMMSDNNIQAQVLQDSTNEFWKLCRRNVILGDYNQKDVKQNPAVTFVQKFWGCTISLHQERRVPQHP